MTAKHAQRNHIQHYIWLIAGLLFLLFAFIFWIMTDTKELVTQSKQIEETQVLIQPEKVAATTNLGGLTEEVRPLQMTTRMVASGNHLAEFRGTKFIEENAKHYSVELFRATNEDVVKSFLQKLDNRKDLIYFRLSGEEQAEQYVLSFGNFKSEHDAKAQLERLTVPLPASVKPQLVKFEDFKNLVNDLGSDELVGGNKVYEVKLKPAAVPVIDESILAQMKQQVTQALAAKTTDPNQTTTRTTVTRKDQQGNVVDVQRSQSAVVPKPAENRPPAQERKPVETQISDPFN
ncbi:hypothetical protein G9F31_08120 [Acinetobacter sp. 187]|uniref:SPOR domain-containing protein n=1 Tax=Acinetobacter lanii TaxID=2715163 RepID=A0A6G8S0T8_9GAMM|nr:hypothetical protein [Acinetobacter lanii]NHC03739.1 hypothetical protein [Acinetobacter lanii]QIO07809.1 hypothetical protein G8D99_01355 [Acinetobacter lanii]